MSEFTQQSVSPSGAPTIEFHFRGDTVRAELAGARLYGEASSDDGAQLTLHAADNELLADIVINRRAHRTLTENVTDIGSALLWSHWRYVTAKDDEQAEA